MPHLCGRYEMYWLGQTNMIALAAVPALRIPDSRPTLAPAISDVLSHKLSLSPVIACDTKCSVDQVLPAWQCCVNDPGGVVWLEEVGQLWKPFHNTTLFCDIQSNLVQVNVL